MTATMRTWGKVLSWLCGVFTNHFPIIQVPVAHRSRIICRRCGRQFGPWAGCSEHGVSHQAAVAALRERVQAKLQAKRERAVQAEAGERLG